VDESSSYVMLLYGSISTEWIKWSQTQTGCFNVNHTLTLPMSSLWQSVSSGTRFVFLQSLSSFIWGALLKFGQICTKYTINVIKHGETLEPLLMNTNTYNKWTAVLMWDMCVLTFWEPKIVNWFHRGDAFFILFFYKSSPDYKH